MSIPEPYLNSPSLVTFCYFHLSATDHNILYTYYGEENTSDFLLTFHFYLSYSVMFRLSHSHYVGFFRSVVQRDIIKISSPLSSSPGFPSQLERILLGLAINPSSESASYKLGYQITLPSAFIPKVVKTIFFNSVTFTFRLLTTIFCIHIMARKHFNFLLQFVIVEIIFAVQTVASLKQVFSHSVVAGDFINLPERCPFLLGCSPLIRENFILEPKSLNPSYLLASCYFHLSATDQPKLAREVLL